MAREQLLRPNIRLLNMATAITCLAAVIAAGSSAEAQFAGGFGGQGGFGGGFGNQGGFPGGIAIDASGVVSSQFKTTTSTRLAKQRAEAFQSEHLKRDIAEPAELRKV